MTTDVLKKKRTSASMTRIDARIPRRLKAEVEQAAQLRDQTVEDFLTEALDEAASRVIMEEPEPMLPALPALKLHVEDQIKLAKILLSDEPFPPLEKMTNLRRYAADFDKVVEQK